MILSHINMQSYLSKDQENQYGDEFYNLHATFAREIRIFKSAEQVVILTNPNNSFIFNDAPTNDIVQYTIQSGTFGARILYGKRENLASFNSFQRLGGSNQPVVRLEDGEVRIKLDPTGSAFLIGCDKVTFDGTIFDVVTSQRPHGLFDPKFDTFYLKKIQ